MDCLDTFDELKNYAPHTFKTSLHLTTTSTKVSQPIPLSVCRARHPFFQPLLKNFLHPKAYELFFVPPKTFSSVVGQQRQRYDKNQILSSSSWWCGETGNDNERNSSVREYEFLDNDDMGVYYVRKFIQLKKTFPKVRWFQIIVAAVAFNSFFKELEKYNEKQIKAYVLEYSRWCDGSTLKDCRDIETGDPMNTHHRHLIVVAKDGIEFLESVWANIHCMNIFTSSKYKICRAIVTWQHLKNILFYVSSRVSRCIFNDYSEGVLEDDEFVEDNNNECKQEVKNYAKKPSLPTPVRNHFYIFTPLSFRFKFCVTLSLFDNAQSIQETITTLKNNCPTSSFAEKCRWMQHPESKIFMYGVQIKDVVLRKELKHLFVGQWTGSFKMYMVKRLKSIQSAFAAFEAANEKQRNQMETTTVCKCISDDDDDDDNNKAFANSDSIIEKFYEIVGNYFWFPPVHFQKILKEVVPLTSEIQSLKSWIEKNNKTERNLEEKSTHQSMKDCETTVKNLKYELIQFVNEKWKVKEKEFLDEYVKKMEDMREDFLKKTINLEEMK